MNNNHKEKFPYENKSASFIYSKEIQKYADIWKNLIKEYERQFSEGTISVNKFKYYINECNQNLLNLHKISTAYIIKL